MRPIYLSIGCVIILAGLLAAYSYSDRTQPSIKVPASSEAEADVADLFPTMSLSLISPAFPYNELIPPLYTCDGENVPPPLLIKGVPENTASLVLVMDDPDIPAEIKAARGIDKFDHWAVYNIPPDTTELTAETIATYGLNGAGETSYTGPCPPPQYEPAVHRYVFRLYALSGTLNFVTTPTLDEIEQAALGMMIEKTELIGRYQRIKE